MSKNGRQVPDQYIDTLNKLLTSDGARARGPLDSFNVFKTPETHAAYALEAQYQHQLHLQQLQIQLAEQQKQIEALTAAARGVFGGIGGLSGVPGFGGVGGVGGVRGSGGGGAANEYKPGGYGALPERHHQHQQNQHPYQAQHCQSRVEMVYPPPQLPPASHVVQPPRIPVERTSILSKVAKELPQPTAANDKMTARGSGQSTHALNKQIRAQMRLQQAKGNVTVKVEHKTRKMPRGKAKGGVGKKTLPIKPSLAAIKAAAIMASTPGMSVQGNLPGLDLERMSKAAKAANTAQAMQAFAGENLTALQYLQGAPNGGKLENAEKLSKVGREEKVETPSVDTAATAVRIAEALVGLSGAPLELPRQNPSKASDASSILQGSNQSSD